MDTSIRLYHTNSNLSSSLEDEQQSRSALPIPEDRDGCQEHRSEGSEEAKILSTPTTVAQPEQVDIAEFEAIFLRFQVPITNFIYHLIGNREQAYDLAQDVFVK